MKKTILLVHLVACALVTLTSFSSCMPKCEENEELEKSGLSGTCKALETIVTDATIPTAPTGLSVSVDGTNPTTTLNLTWTDNSTDEVTFAIDRSTDNVTFSALTSVTAGVTTYADSSCSDNTTYYYRVNAVNTAGGSSYTTIASATTTRAFKYIFVSNSTPAANMIGATGADSICNSDSNRPITTGVTYKAMLGATNGTGQSRTACTTANCSSGSGEHVRWVLTNNTQYRRADGTTIIGTTNSVGIFTFPLTNSFGTCTGGVAWSGFSTDWTSAVNSCGGWTFGGVNDARLMDCTVTNSSALDKSGAVTCNASHQLICVEQ